MEGSATACTSKQRKLTQEPASKAHYNERCEQPDIPPDVYEQKSIIKLQRLQVDVAQLNNIEL